MVNKPTAIEYGFNFTDRSTRFFSSSNSTKGLSIYYFKQLWFRNSEYNASVNTFKMSRKKKPKIYNPFAKSLYHKIFSKRVVPNKKKTFKFKLKREDNINENQD